VEEDIGFFESHPSVKMYLDYVSNTESPRLFHVWSFLSGISAAMGRRCWLPMGTGEVWPNMYVVLTGPPAVRKSTAFKLVCALLRRHTTVKFAPDDTSGQRQGLIAAMMNQADGLKDADREVIEALSVQTGRDKKVETTSLADLSDTLDKLGAINCDTRDPNTMFIAASELNSVLGEGNTALLTFLQKMWDGDPYKYQLKKEHVELKDALLGIIGATTPSQLAIAMPSEAVGQGFTSRVIFVYADKKYARRIARPSLRADLENPIGTIFATVSDQFTGGFTEEPQASDLLDQIYERGVSIPDPRFVHYGDRRHTHLQKLCMALAASRADMQIKKVDVVFGDHLLSYTEQFMPEALGEYGMSKLSAAKQRLYEYLQTTDEPVPVQALYYLMARDMSQMEFKNTLTELHNGKKVSLTTLPGIGQVVSPVAQVKGKSPKKELQRITDLLVIPGGKTG
jgi:hypothetical protein